jgi:stage III sporulation protein AA
MLKDILPDKIYKSLDKIGLSNITDIRIRQNMPVTIFSDKKMYFLNSDNISQNVTDFSIYATLFDIKYILDKLSNNALYSINDDLVKGFVTIEGGIRIGFSGEMVVVNGVSKTLKNISSLCIRIPHFIKNCSLSIYDMLVSKRYINSTLLYGKPGSGKTTMLKDIVYQLSCRHPELNIVVIDSRRELISQELRLHNVDIYYSSKVSEAIESVVRSMCPDIVVLDEITMGEIYDVYQASNLGVTIFATMHGSNISNVQSRLDTSSGRLSFDRYVELSSDSMVGEVKAVYNKDFSPIYL